MQSVEDKDLLRSHAFIDGIWIDAERRTEVLNPATGETVGSVPVLGFDRAVAAVEAAEAALEDLKSWTAAERAAILWRWHALVLAAVSDLAAILTAEQGKPLAEAKAEIEYAASYIAWYAEEARRLYGEVIPSPRRDSRIVVIHQPVGVVAAITPWNFPAAMVTRKLAPAIAAGCPIVLKPAPQTPLTALALVRLLERAGAPRGSISVITGDAVEIGQVLTCHPAVRKVTFTGSTAVGKLLVAQSASTMKRVSMELGGNAPFIVFGDADLDEALNGLMTAKFRNAGQTCVSVNRVYVHRSVARDFEKRLASMVSALAVGPGDAADTIIGPLIDEAAVRKVDHHVKDAVDKGARLVSGGRLHDRGGHYYQPTVLADCRSDMLVSRDETFGPVVALFIFDDDAEVVRLANFAEVGLAAYFYTRNHSRAWRVAEALEVGMVGVNTGLISTEVAPFGGIKQSGVGREGSRHGLTDYTEIKYICFSGI